MGFEYEVTNKDRIVYLAIKYQHLIQPLKEWQEGCAIKEVVNPTTNKPVTKYFIPYTGLTGAKVHSLKWYERTVESKILQGYQLGLKISDPTSATGNTIAIIDFPLGSSSYNTLTKVIENIDPDKPLDVQVWTNKDDKTVISFKQDGQTIKYKYTKDNMGDCPPAVKKLTGWDWSDQMEWLKNRIDTVVVPRFSQQTNDSSVETEEEYPDEDSGYTGNSSEDGDTSFNFNLDNLKY